MFTDEACFTKGNLFHKEHVYANEKLKHFQRDFKINVWAGIICNFIIDPVAPPKRLTGEVYVHHHLPEFFQDLPLQLRRDTSFMHDEASPYFFIKY